ncbi:putative protein kinase UbiB [Frankliniella fusca]|nr:putative protein kinase UbiB [Frankliniella fusca]
MLRDSRKTVRQSAVSMIQKARQTDQGLVRQFRTPTINFDAEDYPNLIDWRAESVTPPPVLRNFDDSALEQAVEDPFFLEENVPAYPCHTQAVERTVQLVTKVSKSVTGAKRRDGVI